MILTSDIIYIILNLLLLSIFCFTGWRISKGGNYLYNSILCIITYTFISGSRYARGVDYLYYADVYKYNLKREEWLFSELNELLKLLGVGPHYIFFYYSFIIVLFTCLFFYRYKRFACWLFPLFIIATLSIAENHIRQFVSFSIVFLYLRQLMLIKKYSLIENTFSIIICILCIVTSYSIHSANIFVIIVLTLLYFTIKKTIPCYISIPIYVFSAYFFNTFAHLHYIESIVNSFSNYNTLFDTYAENSSKWFSFEGFSEIYTRNPLIKFIETFGNIILFYMSGRLIDARYSNKYDLITYTNAFIIGTIFQKAFMNWELLNRMGSFLAIFYFFPLALVLYNIKFFSKNRTLSICSIFLLFWIWDYFRYIFLNPSMTKFLWDTKYF